jgi:hypothetical protein
MIAPPVPAQEEQTAGVDFVVSSDNLPEVKKHYSPFVNTAYPNRVYWGETHLHTSYSWDAGLVGNTLGPDDAYRFAKGDQVIGADRTVGSGNHRQ